MIIERSRIPAVCPAYHEFPKPAGSVRLWDPTVCRKSDSTTETRDRRGVTDEETPCTQIKPRLPNGAIIRRIDFCMSTLNPKYVRNSGKTDVNSPKNRGKRPGSAPDRREPKVRKWAQLGRERGVFPGQEWVGWRARGDPDRGSGQITAGPRR